MRDEIKNRAAASYEAEARARLKSQFEVFSQALPTEAELFAMSGHNDHVAS